MGSHGTRNWNDIVAAATELLDGVDDVARGELGIDDIKADRARLRELLRTVDRGPTDEPTEADQLRRLVKLHMGAHRICGEAFIHMGEAVMRKIADGGSLDDVLEIVGDCMNERDAVGEDCEALFDRAKERALVGGRSAAPTRDEVGRRLWDAIVNGGVVRSDQADAIIDHVTDTALDLLSRSAAEPPEAERALQAIVDDDVYAHTLSGLAQFRANTLATARAALAGGVAAEPNEEAGDGR